MHIEPIRLLENNAINIVFNTDERFYKRTTGLKENKNPKIKEAIIINEDNKNKEKEP